MRSGAGTVSKVDRLAVARLSGGMRPAREDIVTTLVSGALAAPDVGHAYADLLRTLRTAWGAERALLLRRDGDGVPIALVCADPPPSSPDDLDPAALEAACE